MTLREKQPAYLHSMFATSLLCRVTEIKQRNHSNGPWVQNQHRREGCSLLCPFPLEPPSAICSLSSASCNLQKTFGNAYFGIALSSIDTSTPDGPLMSQNCFIDFAVEHRFGYGATESGHAGDIGAMKI